MVHVSSVLDLHLFYRCIRIQPKIFIRIYEVIQHRSGFRLAVSAG